MRISNRTSDRRGVFSSTTVSGVRRLAIIRGSAAFLAPEMGMEPLRACPPTIRMRSIDTTVRSAHRKCGRPAFRILREPARISQARTNARRAQVHGHEAKFRPMLGFAPTYAQLWPEHGRFVTFPSY